MINFLLKYTGTYGLLAILAVAIVTPTYFFFTSQQELRQEPSAEKQDVSNEENVAEIGIGHLSVVKGKILLVRESVYSTIINNAAHAGDGKFLPFRDVERGQTLTVSSYNPPNVESALQEPNSLLKSNSDGPASPIKIENNSVLVCYKNKLVSVTFKELAGLLKRYL